MLWGTSNFLILRSIQFLKMVRVKQLGKQVLSNAYEKEERQWEQNSSYRYPCHPETDQEIYKLEECKFSNELEWY
jgi:hypothetical protein